MKDVLNTVYHIVYITTCQKMAFVTLKNEVFSL